MNDLGLLRPASSPPPPATSLRSRQSRTAQCLLGGFLAWFSLGSLAQTPPIPASPTPLVAAESPAAEAPVNPSSPGPKEPLNPVDNRSAAPAAPAPVLSEAWLSLSKRQRQALAPLSDKWGELTPQQKQKWLALARGFYQLTDPEQVVLHGRMREWAALSPRQRALARFNFNTTMALPIEDKRAQWEAYLQLSDDEKSKLTSGLKAPLKSGARNTGAPNKRLIKPPPLPADANKVFQTIAPRRTVHPQTLLPQPPG